MPSTITIKELHAHTGAWVRKAKQTGEITVTDRGQAIAVIQPIHTSAQSTESGGNLWLNRQMSPELAALQQRLFVSPDSSTIISEMREGR